MVYVSTGLPEGFAVHFMLVWGGEGKVVAGWVWCLWEACSEAERYGHHVIG